MLIRLRQPEDLLPSAPRVIWQFPFGSDQTASKLLFQDINEGTEMRHRGI